MKYERKSLIYLIKEKYGTMKHLADLMEIDQPNLSKKLHKQSSKFIYQLRKYGIDIDRAKPIQEQGDLIVNSNVNKGSNNKIYIESLERELKSKDEIISLLKKQIQLLEKGRYG